MAQHADTAPAHPDCSMLIIEDHQAGRESLRTLLQLLGYRVDVAEDGTEGLRMALALRPQIAIVDIGLPGLDGYEIARRLRAALGRTICLIAHTAYGTPQDQWHAIAAGFDAHLVKPAALEELLALLDACRDSLAQDQPRENLRSESSNRSRSENR